MLLRGLLETKLADPGEEAKKLKEGINEARLRVLQRRRLNRKHDEECDDTVTSMAPYQKDKGISLRALVCASLYNDYNIDTGFAYNHKEAKDHGGGAILVGTSILSTYGGSVVGGHRSTEQIWNAKNTFSISLII